MGGQQQQRPVHRVSRRSSRYGHRSTWIKHARGSMVSSAQQHHPLADELRQQHHTSSMSATWCPNTLGEALSVWALTYEQQTAASPFLQDGSSMDVASPLVLLQQFCGVLWCSSWVDRHKRYTALCICKYSLRTAAGYL